MLGQLEDAIDQLDLPIDTAALASVLGQRDRLDARITELVAAVDAARLWDLDDSTSVTAWLRTHGGRSRADAARLARIARVIGHLPVVAEAWRDGILSTAKVETIVAHLGPHRDRFAEVEADLVPLFADCNSEDVAVAMRAWRSAADDADPAREPDEPVESVHLSEVAGRGILQGDLTQDTYTAVRDALGVADSGELDEPPAQRRAEALGVICRFFLEYHDKPRRRRHRRRPRVALVVTPEQIASGAYGTDLCDAAVHRTVIDGRSTIIDFGRATRTITDAVRDLLDLRDQHCRWPGCDRPATWSDGHHVWPWENGGPTCLDNLALLCRRHHRRVHRPGYHAKLLPDATLEITRPDGTTLTSTPPGVLPQPFW